MPQTHHVGPGARAERVPVGIFLPPPTRGRSRTAPARRLADWHGLDARNVARLVATYTRRGDLVLDLDGHPTITRAARYLRRHPARLVTDRDGRLLRIDGVSDDDASRARRLAKQPGVGLVVWTPPRPGRYGLDLHEMAQAMRRWRALLRPGGFLLTALAAHSTGNGPVSHRSTVITAARAAGLLYHQHLLVVQVSLPDQEPRAEADTAAGTRPRLPGGRHVPAHVDLLVFAATMTGLEAADVGH